MSMICAPRSTLTRAALRQLLRVGADQLHHARLGLAVVVHAPLRLAAAPQALIGAEHFRRRQCRAKSAAQLSERPVGDARHGRQQRASRERVAGDAHGLIGQRWCRRRSAAIAGGARAGIRRARNWRWRRSDRGPRLRCRRARRAPRNARGGALAGPVLRRRQFAAGDRACRSDRAASGAAAAAAGRRAAWLARLRRTRISWLSAGSAVGALLANLVCRTDPSADRAARRSRRRPAQRRAPVRRGGQRIAPVIDRLQRQQQRQRDAAGDPGPACAAPRCRRRLAVGVRRVGRPCPPLGTPGRVMRLFGAARHPRYTWPLPCDALLRWMRGDARGAAVSDAISLSTDSSGTYSSVWVMASPSSTMVSKRAGAGGEGWTHSRWRRRSTARWSGASVVAPPRPTHANPHRLGCSDVGRHRRRRSASAAVICEVDGTVSGVSPAQAWSSSSGSSLSVSSALKTLAQRPQRT